MLMIVGAASVQTSFFTGVFVIRSYFSAAVSSCFTRFHIQKKEAGQIRPEKFLILSIS